LFSNGTIAPDAFCSPIEAFLLSIAPSIPLILVRVLRLYGTAPPLVNPLFPLAIAVPWPEFHPL
jgi:hypothetical protein